MRLHVVAVPNVPSPRCARFAGTAWLVCVGLICTAVSTAASVAASTGPPAPGAVLFLDVEGAIGPPTAQYVAEGIKEAGARQAAALVIELDTPGGLETSMRDITRAILASPVPVVVWVAPRGARAASAGTFLVYASHVAAMAPATSIGAASPVSIGAPPGTPRTDDDDDDDDDGARARTKSVHEQKAINDAAATIRGLAELRGRDAAFAEEAVREAASLSSSEALARGVVEIIAADRAELLRALDQRQVQLASGEVTLQVANAPIVDVVASWPTRLLSILANPNVAYLLLMFGFYGILFELSSPGSVFPGVTGAIALLLALFSLQLLPVSIAGAALLILGFALMIGEAFVPNVGALGAGGVVALILGSLMLIDVDVPALAISRPLIAAVAVVSTLFFVGVLRLGWRARKKPVVSGREQLIGSVATAAISFDDRGPVRVHGEIWSAATESPLREGQAADVVDMVGLVLKVRPRA
jgi:membrane-bound serine protease (ClpP class)